MVSVFEKDRINYLSKDNAEKHLYKSAYTVIRNIMASDSENLWKMYKTNNYTKKLELGHRFKTITILPDGTIKKRV